MPRVFRDVTASREVDEKAMLRKQVTAEKTANEAVEEQGDGRNGVGKRTGREGNNSGIALTTIHTIARERDKEGPRGRCEPSAANVIIHRKEASQLWMDEVTSRESAYVKDVL
jgi:hypothetical protein